MSNKIKQMVIFLKNIHGKNIFWGKKPLKLFEISIKTKAKTFIIDTTKPTYQKDNMMYYFIDYDNGSQYTFQNNEKAEVTPEQIDLFVSTNWLSQIAGRLSITKANLFPIIICSICSALVGVLITYIILQSKIEEILTNGTSIIIG